ncbi:hypothetical protein HMPREF2137_06550 [Hoylesella buccalis DNF00853]|uniref:Uncharacterized protein n=1 Tax=Hoylesella buccalis DNF00853 TaxID=1401074 RepID=A0A095ZJH7_9BACT|nr:hypothetical protein HMPREF2137_06550 [Hoylesella buccalis DNF00853]
MAAYQHAFALQSHVNWRPKAMILAKKWVKKDGTRVIYRYNSLYINNIQKSLIFGVFAPSVSFVCKYAQNKKACCQEKSHP